MEAPRILSQAEVEPEQLPSPKLAPDTETFERVCHQAGTRYRGWIRERTVDGKAYPFVVLFEDRYKLVSGLPLAEFNLLNVQARLLEREPTENRTPRRASPEPRIRVEDSIQDGFERVLTAFRANRALSLSRILR